MKSPRACSSHDKHIARATRTSGCLGLYLQKSPFLLRPGAGLIPLGARGGQMRAEAYVTRCWHSTVGTQSLAVPIFAEGRGWDPYLSDGNTLVAHVTRWLYRTCYVLTTFLPCEDIIQTKCDNSTSKMQSYLSRLFVLCLYMSMRARVAACPCACACVTMSQGWLQASFTFPLETHSIFRHI